MATLQLTHMYLPSFFLSHALSIYLSIYPSVSPENLSVVVIDFGLSRRMLHERTDQVQSIVASRYAHVIERLRKSCLSADSSPNPNQTETEASQSLFFFFFIQIYRAFFFLSLNLAAIQLSLFSHDECNNIHLYHCSQALPRFVVVGLPVISIVRPSVVCTMLILSTAAPAVIPVRLARPSIWRLE